MPAIYTATATATGDGRNGHTRSSDGRVDLGLAVPVEMGGSGDGANPEQLFAAGYAACFHSAIKAVARKQQVKITDSAVTADVSLEPNDTGGLGLAVALHVELGGVDERTANDIVAGAHQLCPYSNAIRGNVAVELDTITG